MFRSLATLGYVRYRHPYFRNELIVAMHIMQDDHFARDKMVSSWAGAMGQTQFMPTQRRRLRHRFLRRRQERHLDQCAGRARLDRQLSRQGALEARPALGLRGHRAEGLRLYEEPRQLRGMDRSSACAAPTASRSRRPATASCFFRAAPTARPSSSRKIIAVLKEYNNSDAYAIAVGHLADRMNGGAADQGRLAGRRPPALARRAHRLAEETCRARLQGASTSTATSISTCATISAPSRKSSACCRTAIRPRRFWKSSA